MERKFNEGTKNPPQKNQPVPSIISFDEFIAIPRLAFRLIGIHISKQQFAKKNFQVNLLHFINIFCLIACVASQLMYILLIEINGIEGLHQKMFASCCVCAMASAINLWFKLQTGQHELTALMNKFNKYFPSQLEDQRIYEVANWIAQLKLQVKHFTILRFTMFGCYNIFVALDLARKYFKCDQWKVHLFILLWYPFDPYQPVVFELCYIFESICLAFSFGTVLSFPFLMCPLIEQLCMHFDQLARSLKGLNSMETERQTEHTLLSEYIAKHNLIHEYVVLKMLL